MAKMEYGYLIHLLTTVDNPTAILKSRKESLFGLIPELRECEKTVIYKNTNPTDIFSHTLLVVSHTPKSSIELRLAALFHDSGKPKCYLGNDKYAFHGSQSRDVFVRFAKNNNLDSELTKKVSSLVMLHDLPISSKCYIDYIDSVLNNFDEEGIRQLFALKAADYKAKLKEKGLIDRLEDLEKTRELCLEKKRKG